jgi:excisionase family DNA binding protein
MSVPGWARGIEARRQLNYPDPLLTSLDETAHLLAISRTTVWRLINAGELDVVNIGSRSLVVRNTINALIARETRPSHK